MRMNKLAWTICSVIEDICRTAVDSRRDSLHELTHDVGVVQPGGGIRPLVRCIEGPTLTQVLWFGES